MQALAQSLPAALTHTTAGTATDSDVFNSTAAYDEGLADIDSMQFDVPAFDAFPSQQSSRSQASSISASLKVAKPTVELQPLPWKPLQSSSAHNTIWRSIQLNSDTAVTSPSNGAPQRAQYALRDIQTFQQTFQRMAQSHATPSAALSAGDCASASSTAVEAVFLLLLSSP